MCGGAQATPVGRSYDGHLWEGVQPSPGHFDCAGYGGANASASCALNVTCAALMSGSGGRRRAQLGAGQTNAPALPSPFAPVDRYSLARPRPPPPPPPAPSHHAIMA
eukprot:SAG25_NODE_60_length_18113_cov_233.489952_3_plen_107_part_00